MSIATGLLTFASAAVIGTLAVAGFSAVLYASTLLAFSGGPEMARFPLFLVRFFVAFVWIVAAVLGLVAARRDSDTQPKAGDA